MKECEKAVMGYKRNDSGKIRPVYRLTSNTKSGYRYGCDLCTDSILVNANPSGERQENLTKRQCPFEECPYAEEIKKHSSRNYDEYDKYIETKSRILFQKEYGGL